MITINLFEEVDLKNYTFIEGFPGAGLVGPMAISYIIDKLQMKYIGYLESEDFPPLVSVHKNTPMPPIRVYCSEKQKIVTIFAEFAVTMDLVSKMSEAVFEFIKENKISAMYSIGGIPAREDDTSPFFIASTESASKDAIKSGLKPIEEGVATGIGALLLVKAVMAKIDDVDIMIPVQQSIIDPMYAEAAVQSLNKLLDLNIDVTELDKEAKTVEAKIKEQLSKHKESHEDYKKAVDSTGPSMYA